MDLHEVSARAHARAPAYMLRMWLSAELVGYWGVVRYTLITLGE